MFKKILLSTFLAFIFSAHAEDKTFVKEYVYTVSDDQIRSTARRDLIRYESQRIANEQGTTIIRRDVAINDVLVQKINSEKLSNVSFDLLSENVISDVGGVTKIKATFRVTVREDVDVISQKIREAEIEAENVRLRAANADLQTALNLKKATEPSSLANQTKNTSKTDEDERIRAYLKDFEWEQLEPKPENFRNGLYDNNYIKQNLEYKRKSELRKEQIKQEKIKNSWLNNLETRISGKVSDIFDFRVTKFADYETLLKAFNGNSDNLKKYVDSLYEDELVLRFIFPEGAKKEAPINRNFNDINSRLLDFTVNYDAPYANADYPFNFISFKAGNNNQISNFANGLKNHVLKKYDNGEMSLCGPAIKRIRALYVEKYTRDRNVKEGLGKVISSNFELIKEITKNSNDPIMIDTKDFGFVLASVSNPKYGFMGVESSEENPCIPFTEITEKTDKRMMGQSILNAPGLYQYNFHKYKRDTSFYQFIIM